MTLNCNDHLLNGFFTEYRDSIFSICKNYFKNDDQLFINNIIQESLHELIIEYESFLKKSENLSTINDALLYSFNLFCRKKSTLLSRKEKKYICPGCFFLGKNNIISHREVLYCKLCDQILMSQLSDDKLRFLAKIFATHNKNGYHCPNCDRFIPHPLDNSSIISCPYYNCYYVGSWSHLKKMNHPFIFELNNNNNNNNNNNKDKINHHNDDFILLKNIINDQINNIPYSSSEFTIKHKILTCQAFSNLLEKFPEEMIDYLIYNSRTGGFQHKVFQEYIFLLENSLPFSFRKNNKIYKIESLLDDQLSLFDGISIFDAIVSDKLEIKNNTKEFYIGGREATYTKPFYIGKLLSILNKKTKESLLNNVKEYSFSKIKMVNVVPNIEVTVSHLRIPPHYQMGGMVYVNRVKKQIVESLDKLKK